MASYGAESGGQVKRVSIRSLQDKKVRGEKFAVLTAYDASFARLVENSGVDLILVGDSLGMVIQGHANTIPVTVDDIVYHSRCVSRVCQRAMVIADIPFMAYSDIAMAVASTRRLIQEGGAQMVKLEGGREQADIISAIVDQGVPVCAHLGLRPQSVHKLGGFRVQGRDEESAARMLDDAILLQQSGADLIVLECVPAQLADRITRSVDVPVIGIGAGNNTDAQVLVLQDILGISYGRIPKFSKNFMAQGLDIEGAIRAYVEAVENGSFPGPEHSF